MKIFKFPKILNVDRKSLSSHITPLRPNPEYDYDYKRFIYAHEALNKNHLDAIRKYDNATYKRTIFREEVYFTDKNGVKYIYHLENFINEVTEDTLKIVMDTFTDAQIGDKIEKWDNGGWNKLSGRAGLNLVRNGEIINTKITKTS